MVKDFAFLPVLSYLRGYFCGLLIDQNYAHMADSSFELLAPLLSRFETNKLATADVEADEAKWLVGPVEV